MHPLLSVILLVSIASSNGLLLDFLNELPYMQCHAGNGSFNIKTTNSNHRTRIMSGIHYELNAHTLSTHNKIDDIDGEKGRKLQIMVSKPRLVPMPAGLSYRAKVSISIYGVIGALIIFGTIYDLVLRQTSKTHPHSTINLQQPFCHKIRSGISSHTRAGESVDGCPTGNIQEISRNVSTRRLTHRWEIIRTRLRLWSLRNKQKLLSVNLKKVMKRLLLCFSVYTNGLRLLNTSVEAGTLRAVNGIRFLSITWVIIGHTLQHCKSMSDNSKEMVRWVLQRWPYQVLENAYISVDSFFTLSSSASRVRVYPATFSVAGSTRTYTSLKHGLLSGLLVSFLTLKELRRNGGKFNVFMYYFHRYFRLTAPMGMVMLFFIPLFEYFGSGPYWPTRSSYCVDTWWKTIFYVNNLNLDKKGTCMIVTWYLVNDMQFYILSPILLLPLYFRPRLGIVVWSMFLITTLTATGVISRTHQLAASFYEHGGKDRGKLIYDKPYTRMGPYLMGLASGWILHRTNIRLNLKWYNNSLVWAVAVATGLAAVYGLVESEQEKFRLTWDVAALYNALHRTVWGAAVSWVVIASATNNGGFVNTLLSWEPFVFLSRCCFMAYLIHLYTIDWFFKSSVKRLHLTDIGVVYRCFGSVSLAFIVSSVATLVMEAPILNIETLIFGRQRRK